MGFAAVYIHIPFCLQKCNYCDFLSFPGRPKEEVWKQYLGAMKQEFALWRQAVSTPIFSSGQDITIYFGGGTPSLAPVEFIGEMTAMIKETATDCGGAITEVTMEMNPGTIDRDYLMAVKKAGVTRISLGAQSFDNEDLAAMGRLHIAEDTKTAVALSGACGFDNISLDLISNLPGQTVEKWLANLKQAAALGVEHISCYGLHLSECSPWGRMVAAGKLELPKEDIEIAMWQEGRAYLREQGYLQYEISNFARAGRECQHNLKYWRRENYLGLGLGAASCYENHRWSNEESLEAYDSAVRAGRLPVAFHEELEDDIVLAEGIFLGLRCAEGISLDEMSKKYSVNIPDKYEKEIAFLREQGLLLAHQDNIKLSPKGQLLANTVFAAFLPE